MIPPTLRLQDGWTLRVSVSGRERVPNKNPAIMTKLKAGLVAAVIVTGVVAAWLIQRQAQKQLEAQVQELRAKSRQVDSFVAENARLSNRLAQAEAPNSLGQEQLAELLRLRGEVGRPASRQANSRSYRSKTAGSGPPPARDRAKPARLTPRRKSSTSGWPKLTGPLPATARPRPPCKACCGPGAKAISSPSWGA